MNMNAAAASPGETWLLPPPPLSVCHHCRQEVRKRGEGLDGRHWASTCSYRLRQCRLSALAGSVNIRGWSLCPSCSRRPTRGKDTHSFRAGSSGGSSRSNVIYTAVINRSLERRGALSSQPTPVRLKMYLAHPEIDADDSRSGLSELRLCVLLLFFFFCL